MNDSNIQPFVSVIVPVYNNLEPLKFCLEALKEQTYPANSYEVIVVDNASEEEVGSIIQQFPKATLVYEEKPGSYAARNKGISVAKGEILAFTDSDCIPAKDWIEQGVKCLLQTPNCGLVGGKIELTFKTPEAPTAVEFYDFINNYLNQKDHISKNQFGATANVFTLSRVFDSVGLFNGELKSGGDMEWGKRVSSQGYQLLYADSVCVKHPARDSLNQLIKRAVRVAGGAYELSFNNRENADSNLIGEVLQRFKPPIKYFRWRLSDNRLKGKKQKFLFVLVTILVDYAVAWELIRLWTGGKAARD